MSWYTHVMYQKMSKKKQVVICRCHDPSPAAAQRVARWAAGCESFGVDFIVSLDNTHAFRESPAERRSKKRKREVATSDGNFRCGASHISPPIVSPTYRLQRAFAAEQGLTKKVVIHRYTEEELLKSFPQLKDLQRYLIEDLKVREMVSRQNTLAWGFHVEALALWWQKKCGKHDYDYVWVLEDDVGITTCISTLLESYENEDADLITDGIKQNSTDWYWKEVHTQNFFAEVGCENKKKVVSKEHVQRLSCKLMEKLCFLSLERGVHCWSEAFTSTVGHCTKEMRVVGFQPQHLGDPFKWNGRVSREEWEKILAEENESTDPKLYHALKF